MKAFEIHQYHDSYGKTDTMGKLIVPQDAPSPFLVTSTDVDTATGEVTASGYIFPLDGSGAEFVKNIPWAGGKLHEAGQPGYTD